MCCMNVHVNVGYNGERWCMRGDFGMSAGFVCGLYEYVEESGL